MITPPAAHHYICTGTQCREADERTIREFGIGGFTLMEIAGTRAADFIEKNIAHGSRGLFLCGKGNNAGDALVIARLLGGKGVKITLCFAAGTNGLSALAEKNLELFRKTGIEAEYMEDLRDASGLKSYDFIVDGLLGTGLNTEVRGTYSEIINRVNEAGIPVFALDVPSGLHADTGRILGNAVNADFTLTFGALKTGLFLNEGPGYAGKIILCELPFPEKYLNPEACLLTDEWAGELIPAKKTRKHKYADGVLYIVAGSEGLAGAAVMAAKSAWAAGPGAVILITPRGLLPVYETHLPQIIKKPVGSGEDFRFGPEHLDEVLQALGEKPGTLLLGPGMGRQAGIITFINALCSAFNGNVVLDADALYALSQQGSWAKPPASEWILTPHPGEFEQLFGTGSVDSYERLMAGKRMAAEHSVTLLAKGAPGFVAEPGGGAFLAAYDTAPFNRAGFGDVLAGKTAAYFLEYQHTVLACIAALFDGKAKADTFFKAGRQNLEPQNLI